MPARKEDLSLAHGKQGTVTTQGGLRFTGKIEVSYGGGVNITRKNGGVSIVPSANVRSISIDKNRG